MLVEELIASTEVESRPYQARIVDKAQTLFCQQELRSVLIDSPTGSGKTLMGLLIAKAMQKRLGVRVGWVAMRRNLLTQAKAENCAKEIHADCQWISMFDKSPPTELEMLVIDEAQHDAAGSMAHLHNVIRPRFILGLSATPFRTDRVKLCFDTVIKDAGIHRLIQDGYLSQFHHYTIPEYTPAAVVDCYLRAPAHWGRTILYFHTLKQCHAAWKLLEQRGIRAEVVTGSSDREAQIEAFREGRIDVLVNCLVLAEGFDCPELKTVFCRPSCRGATIQMCGRVFRKHPTIGFKQVVQCQKTAWPIVRTAVAAEQYTWVDSEWRSLRVNGRINEISGRTLQALAQTETQLPKFLLEATTRNKRRGRNGWGEGRAPTELE